MKEEEMKTKVMAVVMIMGLILMSGCLKKVVLPVELDSINPEIDCQDYANAAGWNLKAELIGLGEDNYLVVYFDPGFSPEREPLVAPVTGIAMFEGQRGNLYYYRLGKLPKGVRVGRIQFDSDVRVGHGGNRFNKPEIFSLERREGTHCLNLAHM
jgi:hypothetical protein